MVDKHIHKVLSILKKQYPEFETFRAEMRRSTIAILENSRYKRLKTDTAIMWVHKGSNTIPRGKKFTKWRDVVSCLEKGEKLRTVRYPKNKATKQLCKKVAKFLEAFTLPEQKGFKSGSNVFLALRCHQGNKSVLELDGASAFDTVPREFVYRFFKDILRLNSSQSNFLADTCTVDGFLYQGNPMSPAIYNVYQVLAIASIRKMRNVEVSSYADDLIISTPFEQMSFKFRRKILKVLKDSGIVVNDKKTRFGKTDRLIKLGGHIHSLEIARKRRFKRRVRLFTYLAKKHGKKHTRRLNKRQEPIEINSMIMGDLAWLNFSEEKRKGKSDSPSDKKKREPSHSSSLINDPILSTLMKQYIKLKEQCQGLREMIMQTVGTVKAFERLRADCVIELEILGWDIQEHEYLYKE